MKTLDTKEWIGVVVAVFVVGFFFVFGQSIISFFGKTNAQTAVATAPQVAVQDTLVGTGDVATPGTRVVIHYVGHFIDGAIFDSSVARNEPLQFVLGSGQVIKGMDEGVTGMKVGGQRIVSIPPELGYGANDYGPIPGGSTLIFEVQLLKVEQQ
jgi:FKBP-type peptidyl-prolyl cis-trans isomerase FkpA